VVQAIHTAVKGRVRYKVEGLYRSGSLKHAIEQSLTRRDGIIRISINTLTGTVLIVFDDGNGCHASSLTSILEQTIAAHQLSVSKRKPPTLVGTAGLDGVPVRAQSNSAEFTDVSRTTQQNRTTEKTPSLRKVRSQVVHAEDQPEQAWHCMKRKDVLEQWGTSASAGLSEELFQQRFKQYGPNILPESVPRSGWSIFFDQFKSLPVALLGVAAGISVATGGLADAVVILGVVVINASIGYTTERQTEKTIHGLKNLVQPSSTVVRSGVMKTIDAKEVVPGDLIMLRPGSYVTADARLIEAKYLSIDESALTGESMPVRKTIDELDEPDITLADRTNMVYMGTLVTGGQGFAIAVATAGFTEVGKIQTMVGEARPPETPLERQMDHLGVQLVYVTCITCGIVFIVGLLRGYGFLQMLKSSIALAVAAVPEGLPTVTTTTLALGIRRMRDLKVLIRHLDAVETLGSVETLCLDKTGTITMNKMSVVQMHAGMRRLDVVDGRIMAEGKSVNPYTSEDLLRLLHLSVLCNESMVSGQEGDYVVEGSSTENALVNLALSAGVDVNSLRAQHPIVQLNHRSEDRHYMSTVHRSNDRLRLMALKGSPSEVLSHCKWYVKDGQQLELDDDARAVFEAENGRMAGEALRVLAISYAVTNVETMRGDDILLQGLVWVGLIGMADVVRSGVKELISTFHRAGIDTVMITGDQSPTAYAIGKELNLSKGEKLEILDSTHLSQLEPDVMKALAGRVHVYARVSPANKLQIVQALQAAGKVVGMTGDGINDGPALKAADIGIALGHTGTDVAREVADVVLEDDNLETMVVAISQGRTIYNNLRKSVRYMLSKNASEIMIMFTALAAGMGQPFNVMQLLWINIIQDIFPGLALAQEPTEPDVLLRPPRNPEEPLIRTADFKRLLFESSTISAGTLAAYGYGILRYGQGPQASTMAFTNFVTAGLLHAISHRSETHSIFDAERLAPNKYLTIALTASLGVQSLTLIVPGLGSFLGMSPLNPFDLTISIGTAVAPLLINEATKKIAAPPLILNGSTTVPVPVLNGEQIAAAT
jgi:P-type Ca2+ transporter type 2C